MNRISMLYSILLIGFLLGIHDGKIALWENECQDPVKVFPYYASMLPERDQKALENGIQIPDSHRLNKLLEDYLS